MTETRERTQQEIDRLSLVEAQWYVRTKGDLWLLPGDDEQCDDALADICLGLWTVAEETVTETISEQHDRDGEIIPAAKVDAIEIAYRIASAIEIVSYGGKVQ